MKEIVVKNYQTAAAQVQGQGALVGVDELSVGVVALVGPHGQGLAGIAAGLALQGLDLDDVGAPVGQHLAGGRAGAVGAEVNDAETFQRLMETHDSTTPL